MNYFLWINSKQQGPYEKHQILNMLLEGAITKQTLCCPVDGAGTWNPVQDLPNETPPLEPLASKDPASGNQLCPSLERPDPYPRPSIRADPAPITRRSGWSLFLVIVGSSSLMAAMVGAPLTHENGGPGGLVFVCGVVGAIQAFLFAFLVDVFTDIRWFLKQLVDRSTDSPSPPKQEVSGGSSSPQ